MTRTRVDQVSVSTWNLARPAVMQDCEMEESALTAKKGSNQCILSLIIV